jgi:prepilin-type N-terminal cleavage/methylation domain-containing protein
MRRGHFGFTLIELLIVVAIIAILAAIAVPNFLEAQTRAKISRVKADQRSVGTALEAYFVDYNAFPETVPEFGWNHVFIQWLPQLTTPVSYITSVQLSDPFTPSSFSSGVGWAQDPGFLGTYQYIYYGGWWALQVHPDFIRRAFIMHSYGPSRSEPHMSHYPYRVLVNPNYTEGNPNWPPSPSDCLYDPTNGTKSRGGIGRCGGFAGLPQVLGG